MSQNAVPFVHACAKLTTPAMLNRHWPHFGRIQPFQFPCPPICKAPDYSIAFVCFLLRRPSSSRTVYFGGPMSRRVLPVLVSLLALAGCGKPPQQKMPPAMVGFIVVKEEPVTLTAELPGR